MGAPIAAHHAHRPDGSASGQVIAVLVILLLALPFLPFVLLVAAIVRVRDRLAGAR